MLLGSSGGRFVRLWRCCLLSVPLGEQASGRRWDCSGLGHVARRCFGTKWYDDVPGARSTRDGDTGNEDNSSFARFFKLDKYAMFSFAMTSGLASVSDKFKIIITLRRAQKFGDTGPCKRWVDPVKGGIAQAWTTWSEGASAPNGTVKCRGHGVPEMVTPASRTTAVLLVF